MGSEMCIRDRSTTIQSAWGSCYYHKAWQLFLVVYVDDFVLAGPKKHLAAGWAKIGERLDIEMPGPLSLYLGCLHERFEEKVDGVTLQGYRYNMQPALEACLKRYT